MRPFTIRIDESRRWRSWFARANARAVGPGWYEPDLWPIIFAMPQSRSRVVIPLLDWLLRAHPDKQQWVDGLRASGATYLFVAKGDPAAPEKMITPPELQFAREGASDNATRTSRIKRFIHFP